MLPYEKYPTIAEEVIPIYGQVTGINNIGPQGVLLWFTGHSVYEKKISLLHE